MKFSLSVIILLFYINSILSGPSNRFLKTDLVRPLTRSQLKRLAEWTEDDKQNIWELSGQFEGDIVLTPNQPLNGLIDESKRWPNRTIPYIIDDFGQFNEKQKTYIHETLKQFAELTCITARPKISSDRDYVAITASQGGCNSVVGRQGGGQQVNLQPATPGSGCLKAGAILHEFLHALGFHHQHSAPDRDLYLNILWDNITPEKKGNFKKYGMDTLTDFGVPYDYSSVMHYGSYAFSKNGKKTIKALRLFASIGQREGFSEDDILKLNRMYGCDPNYPSKQTKIIPK